MRNIKRHNKGKDKNKLMLYLTMMYARYLNLLRFDKDLTALINFTIYLPNGTTKEVPINDIFTLELESTDCSKGERQYKTELQLTSTAQQFIDTIEINDYIFTNCILEGAYIMYTDKVTQKIFVGEMSIEFCRGTTELDFKTGLFSEGVLTYITLNPDYYKKSLNYKKRIYNYLKSRLGVSQDQKSEKEVEYQFIAIPIEDKRKHFVEDSLFFTDLKDLMMWIVEEGIDLLVADGVNLVYNNENLYAVDKKDGIIQQIRTNSVFYDDATD